VHACSALPLAGAQQATDTLRARPVEALAPAAQLTGPVIANGYYYSDRQIDEKDLKSKEVSKEISTKGAISILKTLPAAS
jgi:hypothetical protein